MPAWIERLTREASEERAMIRLLLSAIFFHTLLIPALVYSQEDPSNALRGRALAQRWCAACHLVQLRLTAIDPPTFTAIANDTGKTPEYLRTFLTTPHEDMPPIQLTPAQLDDVIAYLGSLRKR